MTKLKSNQKIPFLSGNTYDGRQIQLKNYLGKPLILSFYRYAGCQLCNLRMHEFIKHYQEKYKDKNIQVVAVFQSPVDKLSKNLYKHHDIPFDIISDPKMHWYKAFGVQRSWSKTMTSFFNPRQWIDSIQKGYMKIDPDGPMNRVPADFLIDKNGVIDVAYYGKDIGDHIPFEIIDK